MRNPALLMYCLILDAYALLLDAAAWICNAVAWVIEEIVIPMLKFLR